MSNVFEKIWNWFQGLWGKVPESTKERIIELVVVAATALLKAIFQEAKKETEENEKQTAEAAS